MLQRTYVVSVLASMSLLLGACATTPSKPLAPFVATGGLATTVGSASYDADQVRGPKINVRNTDGNDWRGTIRDQTIDVSVSDGHVSGVNLTMQIDQQPSHTTITGQLAGAMFRFELTPNQLMVRTPTRSDDLPRTGDNQYSVVNFSGDALAKQPEPQLAFALIGTFL